MIAATELAERFERFAANLGEPTERGVLKVLAMWRGGDLTEEELEVGLVQLVGLANAHARGYADAYAAVLLRELDLVADAVPLGTTGVTSEAELQRLVTAIGAVLVDLDTGGDITARLSRLALSEPVDAAQQQLLHCYTEHGVTGYTRGVDSDPCELCRWLYKDGYVYPADRPFYRHPGCCCHPIPTNQEGK